MKIKTRAPSGYVIKCTDGLTYRAYVKKTGEYLGQSPVIWRAVELCDQHKAKQGGNDGREKTESD